MNATFLRQIFEVRKRRVEAQKRLVDPFELRDQALRVRAGSKPHRLRESLERIDRINIIAEIKRASPSKGVINDKIAVTELARSYELGGACAISILTEEDFFNGSLKDLKAVREAATLPILRKDFIFDEFQIYEAAEAGADAILLIAAMLDNIVLEKLYCLAEQDLGLDVVVEVHTRKELEIIKEIAQIIGVNNRDLHSFETSLDVSRELIGYSPDHALMITESGLQGREDISEMRALGFDGFLIGEILMKSEDPEKSLKDFTRQTLRHGEFL